MKTSSIPPRLSVSAAFLLLGVLTAFATVSCGAETPLKNAPKAAQRQRPRRRSSESRSAKTFSSRSTATSVASSRPRRWCCARASSKGFYAVRIPKNMNTFSPRRPTPGRFTPPWSWPAAKPGSPVQFQPKFKPAHGTADQNQPAVSEGRQNHHGPGSAMGARL